MDNDKYINMRTKHKAATVLCDKMIEAFRHDENSSREHKQQINDSLELMYWTGFTSGHAGGHGSKPIYIRKEQ